MQTAKEIKTVSMTVSGGYYVPERMLHVIGLEVTKAFEMSGNRVEDLVINIKPDHPRNGTKSLFSTFAAPNVINLNLAKHIDQMETAAQAQFMRGSTILWYELLCSLGHELYHALMEYIPFMRDYGNNVEAQQIGPKYNCTKAEEWGKKLVLALGFETNIDPPDEWATGMENVDLLSETLSEWQCSLPNIDETWAKRQQEMIDRNIAWLDDEELPHITLDTFSDWLAIEGGWDNPIWKIRTENEVTDIKPEPEIPNLLVQPPVNPTMTEVKTAMYYTFMTVYQKIFTKCGWKSGTDGFYFTSPEVIKNPINIKDIPQAELVLVNSTNQSKQVVPIWPEGNLQGMVYLNRTIPAVKIGIRSTSGKIFTYTAIAQNPKKESSWGKQARAGAKSIVVFRDESDSNSAIAVRILDGVFISNPLKLNGTEPILVTPETLNT